MSKVNEAYKNAGVDIHAGYEAVKRIKPHTEKTYIPGVLNGLGGFGGCFELPKGYENPVLVSGTDGVGTKLKVAVAVGKHDKIGIDCVAMCVNDIVCQGAKPLYFLDYIAVNKLEPSLIEDIVKGVSEGCIQAGCALLGGETAEQPDIYSPGEYDMAGFAVGIAEKSKVITGEKVAAGDVLIGIASSGMHSNGFALARKITFDIKKMPPDTYVPELGKTLGEELLTPTKIYVKTVLSLLENFDIHGAANITGGGWIENIPRLLGDEKCAVEIKAGIAPVPAIFTLLQSWGGISKEDMYNTFNMGIGLVLAVPEAQAEETIKALNAQGEKAYAVGKIVERKNPEEEINIIYE